MVLGIIYSYVLFSVLLLIELEPCQGQEKKVCLRNPTRIAIWNLICCIALCNRLILGLSTFFRKFWKKWTKNVIKKKSCVAHCFCLSTKLFFLKNAQHLALWPNISETTLFFFLWPKYASLLGQICMLTSLPRGKKMKCSIYSSFGQR